MPNLSLNAVTAPDNYDPIVSTIDTSGPIDHFNLDVSNQPIFWQMRQVNHRNDSPGLAVWQSEVYMTPGSRTINRQGLVGARFRAAIPAASLPLGVFQAVVTLEVVV